MNRNHAAKRPSRQFRTRAASKIQHCLVKYPPTTSIFYPFICLITAVGVMYISSAALLKLPASATLKNVSSWGVYIGVPLFSVFLPIKPVIKMNQLFPVRQLRLPFIYKKIADLFHSHGKLTFSDLMMHPI